MRTSSKETKNSSKCTESRQIQINTVEVLPYIKNHEVKKNNHTKSL